MMNDECWLEMDLYWFQGGEVDEKVRVLFDRITPLLDQNPDSRKGLSICVGWLFDSALFWNADPDAVIPCCQAPKYEPWTYRRLRDLLRRLKGEAQARKIKNFHLTLPLMGIETQSFPESAGEGWGGRTEEPEHKARYDIEGKWFFAHPEVIDTRFGKFHFGARFSSPANERVSPDSVVTFGEYFSYKLVGLVDYVGFDAVLFRDHVFTKAYCRGSGGPRYMPPAWREELNAGILAFFRKLKDLRPNLVTIGYSSGSSSIEEWRSHGFDLESLALSGCLDLWITQTWGSAWQDYWPMEGLGFTFQLANLLIHAAMLAHTPTKHLFVLETFDAWEPWNSIREYPDKVAWEIWAYSHAAVLLPDDGVRRAAGFYLSWLHREDQLLSEETVRTLCGWIGTVAAGVAEDPRPGGPCIVYDRATMDFFLEHPSAESRGEELDDLCAMLMKFGTPILSVTRREFLSRVEADGWIVPSHSLNAVGILDWVRRELDSGKGILVVGHAADLDAETRAALALEIEGVPVASDGLTAVRIQDAAADLVEAQGGAWFQKYRSLRCSPGWISLLESLDGPVFVQSKSGSLWFWEPPEWGDLQHMALNTRTVGSPEPWQAVAMVFGDAGWGREKFRCDNEELDKPVNFLFWRRAALSGEACVLFANLETALVGNSQFCVKCRLQNAATPQYESGFAPVKWSADRGLRLTLLPHRMAIAWISSFRAVPDDMTPKQSVAVASIAG